MKKDKFTLTGTDNDGFRHRYSFKKTEEFKKAFLKFMADLKFDPKIISRTFFSSSFNTFLLCGTGMNCAYLDIWVCVSVRKNSNSLMLSVFPLPR